MTTRINGQGFRPVDAGATRRTETAKNAEADTAGTASKATGSERETVKLTRSAVLLSKLAEVVKSSPAVDADRVRAIKEKLASGTYQIDDQSVADQMIRMDRELSA